MIKLQTPNQGGFPMNIIATNSTLHNHFYKTVGVKSFRKKVKI